MNLIIDFLKKINFLLGFTQKKSKNKILVTLIILLFSGVTESLVILLIVPFTKNILILSESYNVEIIRYYSLLLAFLVLISGIVRTFALKRTNSTSAYIVHDISEQVFKKLLFQKYRVENILSPDEMIARITFLDPLLTGIVAPIWQIINGIIMGLMILSILIYKVGLIGFIGLSITIFIYLFVAKIVKKRLFQINRVQEQNKEKLINIINSTALGIRDIRVNSLENNLTKSFIENDLPLRITTSSLNTIAGIPRILFETSAILIITIFIFFRNYSLQNNLIPELAILLVAVQRLMPIAQGLYGSGIGLITNKYVVEAFYSILSNLPQYQPIKKDLEIKSLHKKSNILSLNNLSYFNKNDLILNKINIDLPSNNIIGIYGKSGSGKSTLLDIISGLLNQSSGEILLNGQEIKSSERLRLVSMVSQDSYIFPSSIKYNITFKDKLNKYEEEFMHRCADIAEVSGFVKQHKDGFSRVLGSSGFSNISGGQIQRICIARALYNKSNILILDEATSSLDLETSKVVLQAIKNNFKSNIVLLVSHKSTDLEFADIIFKLENNSINIQENNPNII